MNSFAFGLPRPSECLSGKGWRFEVPEREIGDIPVGTLTLQLDDGYHKSYFLTVGNFQSTHASKIFSRISIFIKQDMERLGKWIISNSKSAIYNHPHYDELSPIIEGLYKNRHIVGSIETSFRKIAKAKDLIDPRIFEIINDYSTIQSHQ